MIPSLKKNIRDRGKKVGARRYSKQMLLAHRLGTQNKVGLLNFIGSRKYRSSDLNGLVECKNAYDPVWRIRK